MKTNKSNSTNSLSDVDIMKDCMYTQSFLTIKYNLATSGSKNIPVRNCLMDIYSEEHNISNEIQTEIEKRKWITPSTPADAKVIDTVKTQFNDELSSL